MNIQKSFIASATLHLAAVITVMALSLLTEKIAIDFDVQKGLSSLRIYSPAINEQHTKEDGTVVSRIYINNDLLVTISSEIDFFTDNRDKHHESPEKRTAISREMKGAINKRAIENSRNYPPHYPYAARKLRYQGNVLLSIEVLPSGQAGEVRVVRSSGYSVLDRAALEAAKKWIFFGSNEMSLPEALLISQEIAFVIQ